MRHSKNTFKSSHHVRGMTASKLAGKSLATVAKRGHRGRGVQELAHFKTDHDLRREEVFLLR